MTHWIENVKKNLAALSLSIVKGTICLALTLFTFNTATASDELQSAKVNIKQRTMTIRQLIKQIEEQTTYLFVVNAKEVNLNDKVSVNQTSSTVERILRESLKGKNYDFTMKGRNIIISRKKTGKAKNVVADTDTQQDNAMKKVSGTITDRNGDPLIGVTISDGKGNGTITDINGNYTLNAAPGTTLKVSYVGYTTQNVKVGNKQVLPITLDEDNKILDEVVVVGYGTTTRKSIVGAVDQIKSDMFTDKPVANVTQALQGASPNLIIQRRSFNPNSSADNLNIRGISTTNSNSPLVIIDGLVCGNSALNELNPNDIDNISILKDAGSAAIYGSRSANGVILVTTKKGNKNERTRVKFNSQVGWEDPHILFHPVEGYQNATLMNLARTNSGMSPAYTPEQIRDLYDHRNEESWFLNEIFRTALQQNHNLSVSGGSDKTTYMVSMGYYDQESNYVGNDNFGLQRYNLRSNITTEVGRFKFQALMAYTRNNSVTTTGGSLEIDASRIPPYYYYKMKENGKYLLNDVLSEFNPLGSLESGGTNKYRNNDFTANVNAEFKIIEGLKLRGVLGVDVGGQHRYTRVHKVPYYYDADAEKPARYSNENLNVSDWNYDSYLINTQLLLDYNRSFGKHNVSGLFGVTNESYTASGNEIAVKYANEDLGTTASDKAEIAIGGGSFVTPENTTRTSITSVLGRAGYNFADKYYAEFSFRVDGSSKFASKNRWGFFPSLSLGWRLSEEAFMADYKEKVGNLKLRTSYGVLGNQTIGTYDRFTTYNMYTNSYAYNNETVTGAGFTLGSDDLKWEKTHTLNIGVDATFLNDALTVTMDYFYKRTVDILMKPVVPSVFGTSQSMANLGEVSNKGWELSASYRFNTGDMRHEIRANIADSYNKLEKFPEGEQISSIEELWTLRRTGVPLGCYYGYKTDGFFKSYEEIETSATPVGISVQPGDLKFKDRNNDGIIDSKDRYILGNAFPRYTFGFTYMLNWKGLDFSVFAQGVLKRDMMLRGELLEPFHSNYSYCIYKHQLDYWTPTHTDAKYPRLSAPGSVSSSNNWRMGSDMFILNGAYMRLKNITLGYTLPQKLTSRVGMEKLRIYVTGQNLLTFSHNSFIDPESSEFNSQMTSGGANSGRNYPTLRYYGLGLDIVF